MSLSCNSRAIRQALSGLLLVFLIVGCTTTSDLFSTIDVFKEPDQGIVADAGRTKNEGVVFGTLDGISHDINGNRKAVEAGAGYGFSIRFGTASDPIAQVFDFGALWLHGRTNASEFFAIRLPAGTYYMYELSRPMANSTINNGLVERFTVTPNVATYIGAIQIKFFTERSFLGLEKPAMGISLAVKNEFDNALVQYKEKNPHLAYEITTSLMSQREQ